jgi:hypothetical protein
MIGIDAGGLFVEGTIRPRGRYSQGINQDPAVGFAAGIAPNLQWQKGDFRAPVTNAITQNNRVLIPDRAAFNHLLVIATGGNLMLLNAGGGFALAAADSGRLTTAAPAALEHGIPTNFGRGRGQWREADIGSLKISEHSGDVAALPANFAAVNTVPAEFNLIAVNFLDVDADGLGDIQLDFFNHSGRTHPAGSSIEVDFVHSIAR